MSGIDLDALLGESLPKPLTYKKQTFDLPGELPAEVLAPFLAPDLGLIELIADALSEDDTDESEGWVTVIIGALKKRTSLPVELLAAFKDAFRILLDAEQDGQFDRFQALKPSVNAYVVLAVNIGQTYGMGLSDFFGSGEPLPDGESSKETSSDTSESTDGASGGAHAAAPAQQPVGEYVPEPTPEPTPAPVAVPVVPAPTAPSSSG